MALSVIRKITEMLHKSPFLTVMIDETTDVTNQEQVTIIIRWIKDDFEVNEEFIGLYAVPRIDAATLFSVIKDTLTRLNLSFRNIRGQCYDGCSTMTGSKSGVAKRVLDEESRAVFTHCYCHSLNLAANDFVKNSKVMKSSLEVTHEITKLIKLSPRRDNIFRELKASSDLKNEINPLSIRLLCPTRWTVRANSLLSILKNYSTLLSTWEVALEVARDTESKARIQGVSAQMNTFQFTFGTMLGEMVLHHTDNLSRSLQEKVCSATEGQIIAAMVVDTLQSLRNDASFELFWSKVTSITEPLDIEPLLPCQRMV